MSQFQIEHRYAKAAYGWLSESNTLKSGVTDMQKFNEISKSPEAIVFFNHHTKKQSLLLSTLKSLVPSVSKETIHFLDFLASKKRIHYIFGIARAFIALHDKNSGIKKARLISAKSVGSLGESFMTQLKSHLKKRDGNDYEIHGEQDSDLIGGFQIRIDNTMLDHSIAGKLELLRKDFRTGKSQ